MKALLLMLALTGCASAPIVTPTEVRVPVPVITPCVERAPDKPVFIDRVKKPQSPADVVALLAAGIVLRDAFIDRVLAVLTACAKNQKGLQS